MATYFHNTVTLDGFFFEDSQFTVLLATTIVAADIGKALSKDSTVANKFKLAANGDIIEGKLITVEKRTTESGNTLGTLARRFGGTLPVLAADALAPGDRIIGAGSGEIRKATGVETMDLRWMVCSVASSLAVIMSS